MKQLKFLYTLLVLTACSSDIQYRYVGCSIDAEGIFCPDGSKIEIQNPINGEDGKDSILQVVDPCGDYIHANNPNHQHSADEVLLFLSDGSVLAWYKDLGLSILQEDVKYITTDKQQCHFKIQDGQYIEL